jgi:uncharacterized protein YlaI
MPDEQRDMKVKKETTRLRDKPVRMYVCRRCGDIGGTMRRIGEGVYEHDKQSRTGCFSARG